MPSQPTPHCRSFARTLRNRSPNWTAQSASPLPQVGASNSEGQHDTAGTIGCLVLGAGGQRMEERVGQVQGRTLRLLGGRRGSKRAFGAGAQGRG